MVPEKIRWKNFKLTFLKSSVYCQDSGFVLVVSCFTLKCCPLVSCVAFHFLPFCDFPSDFLAALYSLLSSSSLAFPSFQLFQPISLFPASCDFPFISLTCVLLCYHPVLFPVSSSVSLWYVFWILFLALCFCSAIVITGLNFALNLFFALAFAFLFFLFFSPVCFNCENFSFNYQTYWRLDILVA